MTDPRTCYVNGRFVAEADATVSVFDRGFVFADAVYEVTAVLEGRLVDFPAHMGRLRRSLRELGIVLPMDDAALLRMHRALIDRNRLIEGGVYLQVSRGACERDFVIPADLEPTVVAYTQAHRLIDNPKALRGLSVVSTADIRWARCDIKSVALLASSLAKSHAVASGADDAWFVHDGLVTEGTSNNAWIVTGDGVLVTRQLGNDILHGITRRSVMELAMAWGLTVQERPFGIEEAQSAQEAFATSAMGMVLPVVRIDGVAVGSGRPGPIVQDLRARYIAKAMGTAHAQDGPVAPS